MKEIIKDELLCEQYTHYVHPTGVKVYLMRKKGYNSNYAVFGTAYGSVDTCFSKDGGEKISVPEGIAHFLEHKLFESEENDAFELFSKTGASANAYTSFDRTCYLFSCADKLKDNLKILLNFVQSPYFTAKTVKKEQGIIGQEIQMYLDSPGWRVMFNLLKVLYSDNPVRIDIAGTRESIAEIDDKLLYDCYNTFYNPDNMFLIVIGDFDEDEISGIIDEGLKERKRVEIKRYKKEESEEINGNYIEESLQVAKPLFMVGFKDKTPEGYTEIKRQLVMELCLDIVFGKSSYLYKKLLNKGLLSSPFDYEYFCTRNTAAVMISGETDDPKLIKEEILKELKRINKEGIDEELFSAARSQRYGDEALSFDDIEDIASMLVDCAVTGGTAFDDINLLKKVTKEDCEECLKYLTEDRCALSVIKEKVNND